MSFRPLRTLGRGFILFWRALDETRRAILNLLHISGEEISFRD